LRIASGAQVGENCADEAKRIDAPMLVEAAVLRCDHRLDHMTRQQIERHVIVTAAALGENGAITRQNADHRRTLGLTERQGVRQCQRVTQQRAADDDHDRDGRQRRQHDDDPPTPRQALIEPREQRFLERRRGLPARDGDAPGIARRRLQPQEFSPPPRHPRPNAPVQGRTTPQNGTLARGH